jgi:hypothetical protein
MLFNIKIQLYKTFYIFILINLYVCFIYYKIIIFYLQLFKIFILTLKYCCSKKLL